ncbi:exonuclease domain-containing protein [Aquibacillus albus]|uniref:DNA polymerase-3 subunit epsilon n=1 Tax=Aquibacillus albus TaxID=1168171 RepID=A0ABS2N3U2_9BACI|nr:exonuclease domain-containing protein [Aquibacillus albus]MBM7572814.1 DNA polymerase-3 subunit epsilon [Aquibacillus albus]
MGFEQFIQFMKQVQGRVGSAFFTSYQSQMNPQHIALLRDLHNELNVEKDFTTPLDKLNVVVFDLETTGFFPDQGDSILSIGGIKVRGSKILEDETFYSCVFHDAQLSSEIKELTGLTDTDVKQAPSLSDVVHEFFGFIQKDTLVAHHAAHEKGFMQKATWELYRTQFQHRIVDITFLIRLADPDLPLQLDDCCERCGIPIKNRHHALGDAKMTAKLWSIYVEKLQALGYQTLRDVYEDVAKKT